MVYVLGIDGGGTKTVCLLMDETGNILSRGKSGASNYQTIGIDATKIAIQTAINKAIYSFLDDKNYKKILIKGLGIGLAGVGRQEDFNVINNLVEQVKINLKSSINSKAFGSGLSSISRIRRNQTSKLFSFSAADSLYFQ
jgi:N-acetylglucosamine kinase